MDALNSDIPTISRKPTDYGFWEVLATLALILALNYILKTEVETHQEDKNA